MPRTYLRIPHARVDVRRPSDVAWTEHRQREKAMQIRSFEAVLTSPRRDGPIWVHFVAVARLVYAEYTAAIAV
jgi:hypothetical protein